MADNLDQVTDSDKRRRLIWGNPASFTGEAIVAFVDLLGFSRAVKLSWKHDFHHLLEKLKRIGSASAIPGKLGPIDFAAAEKVLYVPRLKTIADSILIFMALPEKPSDEVFCNSIGAVALNVQWIWKRAIEEEFTIRGGVEIGQMYWDQDLVMGPALVAAHELESKIANWSRILLGPRILKRLHDRANPLTIPPLPTRLATSSDGFIELPYSRVEGRDSMLLQRLQRMATDHYEKYAAMIDVAGGKVTLDGVSYRGLEWASRELYSRLALHKDDNLWPLVDHKGPTHMDPSDRG